MRRWVRGRGGGCEHADLFIDHPLSGVDSSKVSPWRALAAGMAGIEPATRALTCLSPLTSKPLVPLYQTGHPRSVAIDRLLLTKTQAGADPANFCKNRDNCNLPGDNCQVVSASEFCSHTTVTYQSLTSPARALGPVDIQEFNEPELALMVCMLTSRLVIHKFNISLKRKKLLPQRMMRMQELGRDYKRFCSFWRVARAASESRESLRFKGVSVASTRRARMDLATTRLPDRCLPSLAPLCCPTKANLRRLLWQCSTRKKRSTAI